MRILHIGDIVGKPGRLFVIRCLPILREREELDLVIANAENASGGSGLTPQIYRELVAAGVQCITLGDHIYRRREIISILEADEPVVKPANFPPDAPGKTWVVVTANNGVKVAVPPFRICSSAVVTCVCVPSTAESSVFEFESR